MIEVAGIVLDPTNHIVTHHGEDMRLSSREFSVLQVLMENAGRFVTKARLEEQLYGWDAAAESNTVEVYISRLRKKFGADTFKTLRGVGYMMEEGAA